MEDLKNRKKTRMWFTLDEEVFNEFENHITEENLNKSKLLQHLIEAYLKKINKK